MSFHPRVCPNSNCTFHQKLGGTFIRKGFFRIQRLNQKVRRFQCLGCRRTLSSRSFKSDFRHKKMDLNQKLQKMLCEGNSLRGSSRILGITYRNTYRKFLWLAEQASKKREVLKYQASKVYFDEMETILHTKCKPLSIALAVNEKYQILSLQVAEMPAKGRLAKVSIAKYGPIQDQRESALRTMFELLKNQIPTEPREFKSDAKHSYRKYVQEFFPLAGYETHSRAEKERYRDRLHEKRQKQLWDPMFPLNQRCAKLRSDIKRLTRRSWCTTKKLENLQGHLDIYLVQQFN